MSAPSNSVSTPVPRHVVRRAARRVGLFLVIVCALLFFANVLTSYAMRGVPSLMMRNIAMSYANLAVLLIAHYVALHWLDSGRPWSTVGLGPAAAQPALLTSGFYLGALAIGVPSMVLLVTGELRVEPTIPGNWWSSAAWAAVFLLPAAFVEELLLRGYIFATLRDAFGWKSTLLGTSVVFGLLHLANPGADAESTMLVIFAGFFLGAILLVTQSLYAAWMAHFAWNWVMAGAMHTAVSGLALPSPNYQIVASGPVWLTGGSWGPEGGVAAGLSMFGFLVYLYSRHLKTLQH